MIQEDGPLFIADTHVQRDPTPEQIATTIGAARHARRFGVTPKRGAVLAFEPVRQCMETDSARRMRAAMELLDTRDPDFSYEGEMNGRCRARPRPARPHLPQRAL